jgi:hypothetical protein
MTTRIGMGCRWLHAFKEVVSSQHDRYIFARPFGRHFVFQSRSSSGHREVDSAASRIGTFGG